MIHQVAASINDSASYQMTLFLAAVVGVVIKLWNVAEGQTGAEWRDNKVFV